ncbi:ATP-dependent Clp protease ATP-binding subunit ClpX [Streptomyces hydrogenans]|uniref:ATP-dependent Clp protease ATP-binding subunit ClpX n=1 Tax=Streptomyces hydrogenans TaxID=1873719 RepID=UPI003649FD6D
MDAPKIERLRFCSFCGGSEREVEALLAGTGAFICAGCVEYCAVALRRAGRSADKITALTPSELVATLNESVIGQDEAKRSLAVAVYNHYKRVNASEASSAETPSGRVRLRKSNILLVGPTGSGKTLLAEVLARTLDVPLVIADVTGITQAGYSGDDVSSILQRLAGAADGDVARAQRGIVFLDEVDKLARRNTGGAKTLDVSGEGVQQSLLKMLEGAQFTLEGTAGRAGVKEQFVMDTSQILFIAGGAFPELTDSSQTRRSTAGMGFRFDRSTTDSDDRAPVPTAEDLADFGLIPEFIGRFPVIVGLDELTVADLERVLSEPADSLVAQYRELFALDGHTLEFGDGALRSIAEASHRQGRGARGLRSVMEAVLRDHMYRSPDLEPASKVLITREEVLAQSVAVATTPTGPITTRRMDALVPQPMKSSTS